MPKQPKQPKPSRTQVKDLKSSETELTTEEARQVKGGNSTAINRVKTSDKQQKAVLDFVKD